MVVVTGACVVDMMVLVDILVVVDCLVVVDIALVVATKKTKKSQLLPKCIAFIQITVFGTSLLSFSDFLKIFDINLRISETLKFILKPIVLLSAADDLYVMVISLNGTVTLNGLLFPHSMVSGIICPAS